MKILRSFVSAFLMYSRIPMPRVAWSEENRRYALCFFPFVGAAVGGLLLLWYFVCGFFGAGRTLFSAVSCAIPVLVSGGIHLDGFCDVCDAKGSCAPREKKLEIMRDPQIGSFAAIFLCVYFLMQFGLFSEISSFRTAAVVSCGYMLSRALSALAAVTFRSAKKDGALQSFVRPAHKRATLAALCLEIAAICAAMLLLNPLHGGIAIAAAGISFLYYRLFSYRNFGGVTGDLAGYFLQICELAILAGAALPIERAIL